jgi:uncharacterized caspase-like protein
VCAITTGLSVSSKKHVWEKEGPMKKGRKLCYGWVVSVVVLLGLVLYSHAADPKQGADIERIMSHINGKKFALVVGINAYRTMPLEAAVNDAKAVSKRLSELNFQVTTLLDAEATLQSIRHELGTKFSMTNPNDQIVIYFAGHGVTEELHDKSIQGYILPVDADIKDLYTTAISMKELRNLTARIPAKHILFAFDSCYSGLGLKRAIKVAGSRERMQEHLESLAGSRGVYMITAGKANEVAREFRGHGLFTLHFLDGIAGAADTEPKDNIVQGTELGQYLAEVVATETNREQNPQHGLIEGDGDFLFPLTDDDPVRLRESVLVRLTTEADVLLSRKSIQEAYSQQMKLLLDSEKVYRDEYDRKVKDLDAQIQEKQKEIMELSKSISEAGKSSTTREQYNLMKFLNTGIEVDILKVFPTLKDAEEYFSHAFGYKGSKPLSLKKYDRWCPDEVTKSLRTKNSYPTKISSYTSTRESTHWLRKAQSVNLYTKSRRYTLTSGYVGSARVRLLTPSLVLSRLDQIDAPLKQDQSTYIKKISYTIPSITSNNKLLMFNQFTDRMIARYGNPTGYGKEIWVSNWKTDRKSKYREMIWEDENVVLKVSGERDSIYVHIKNKSRVFDEIYNQAVKMCEAEQLILLKQRIEKMAELERSKTLKAKSLEF